MPRKRKADKPFDGGFNVKQAIAALSIIEDDYHLAPEFTIELLKQSFEKAYKNIVNDNLKNVEDMRVEAEIDIDRGVLTMYEIKDVVEEVEDDFMQIELSEAKEIEEDAKPGDQIRILINLSDIGTNYPHKVISIFSQRMKEEARASIKESYMAQVGHIITGVVENSDDKIVAINCGKASGVLFKRDLLRDEILNIGQKVKVFLKGVDDKKKNGILLLSRSDDGFLRCLLEDHIQEISDGIIKIEAIARDAGVRSKVAVSSTNPSIDPAGSCIGPDGTRIKSIVDELGSERIDIIHYSPNISLFVVESLHPASVVGISIDEENRRIVAVVKNDESKKAIGKSGINVRLASRLVKYSIDIKELDMAMAEKLNYTTIEDIRREISIDKIDEQGQQLFDKDPMLDDDEEGLEDFIEEKSINVSDDQVITTSDDVDVVERIKINVSKPKVSLSDLEAQIENEKKNKQQAPQPVFRKKEWTAPKEKSEPVEIKPVLPTTPVMPIYSQEELAEIEAEEKSGETSFEYDDYDDYDEKY